MSVHKRIGWFEEFKTAIRVGFFLAIRDIKRANKWTTGLIVMVMILTFLNLIVVSGILVGLVEGIIQTTRSGYVGDILITSLPEKQKIENTQNIVSIIKAMPEVALYNVRYTEPARIEANYRERKRETDIIDNTAGIAVGINPEDEDAFSKVSKFMVEGSFLEPDDYDQVVLGANFLYKYTPIESPDMRTLKNVGVGSKIRLIVAGVTREVTIKGVIKSKVTELDQRIFMVDSQFRNLVNRFDLNANEISIKLKPGTAPETVRDSILANGAEGYARVQTAEEAQPKFVKDIQATFAILGNLISSVGLAVASITIFIVIFVNAITRRRYIGILKGIGISARAIEISYVIQSLFYALCGILIGLIIIFGFLKPYFDANPIDFPFSDGILVATFVGTAVRVLILFIATMVAGYIPARIVVKQNTLNAILGR